MGCTRSSCFIASYWLRKQSARRVSSPRLGREYHNSRFPHVGVFLDGSIAIQETATKDLQKPESTLTPRSWKKCKCLFALKHQLEEDVMILSVQSTRFPGLLQFFPAQAWIKPPLDHLIQDVW